MRTTLFSGIIAIQKNLEPKSFEGKTGERDYVSLTIYPDISRIHVLGVC